MLRTADGMVIETEAEGTAAQEQYKEVLANDELDNTLGFARHQGAARVGWLVNIESVRSLQVPGVVSGVFTMPA